MSKTGTEKFIEKSKLLKLWIEQIYKDDSLLSTINIDKREIRFTYEIESAEINGLIRTIELLHDISPEPILLTISSNGGSPESALLFVEKLKVLKDTQGIIVNTRVEELVASAATIIAMGATGTRYMSKYAHMMFHQVSTWSFGLEKKNDTKSKLEYVDGLSEIILQFYIDNSLIKDREKWDKILSVDTYINAEDCKKLGIIDDTI